MKKTLFFLSIVFFVLPLCLKGEVQDTLRPYVNVGYITSIVQPEDCTRPDAGGSVRLGILRQGRLGFYGGYAWFNEYHEDYIEYDDEGRLYIAGIDYRILESGKFQLYAKLGVALEKFISTYPSRTETETSIKPDFGFLFNINYFNAYLGWQPSAPSHFNVGIGLTLHRE